MRQQTSSQPIPTANSPRNSPSRCCAPRAWETPTPAHLDNTGAYLHRLDPAAVHTAGTGSARTVRVLTPPGALTRSGQKRLVAEATEIVAKIAGDPAQAGRTWVVLTEAAEGGWGIAGTAFGGEEFVALLG